MENTSNNVVLEFLLSLRPIVIGSVAKTLRESKTTSSSRLEALEAISETHNDLDLWFPASSERYVVAALRLLPIEDFEIDSNGRKFSYVKIKFSYGQIKFDLCFSKHQPSWNCFYKLTRAGKRLYFSTELSAKIHAIFVDHERGKNTATLTDTELAVLNKILLNEYGDKLTPKNRKSLVQRLWGKMGSDFIWHIGHTTI